MSVTLTDAATGLSVCLVVPATGSSVAGSDSRSFEIVDGDVQVAHHLEVGVAGYYALTSAMRMGDVGVITPFRYTRLVFALILGVALFGERPDGYTLIGSAIIVASGIYTLIRGRRRAVQSSPAN